MRIKRALTDVWFWVCDNFLPTTWYSVNEPDIGCRSNDEIEREL